MAAIRPTKTPRWSRGCNMMMAKNSLGKHMLTRLKVFKGAEHIHAAQKPEVWAD